MTEKITIEMIYELQKQQLRLFDQLEQRMNRFEHNQERSEDKNDKQFRDLREYVDDRFENLKECVDDQFKDIDDQLEHIRIDVASLNKLRINWDGGIMAGLVAASSIFTLILIRILSSLGVKIAEGSALMV